MITTETQTARTVRTAYFRSFLSYRVPFEPEDEISFTETEGLASYYVARYDADERLCEFDKILLTRVQRLLIRTAENVDPSSARFFAVKPERANSWAVGSEIAYAATEGRSEFFASAAGQAGPSCIVSLMRKEVVMRDRYSYWASGGLRKRILTRMDESESVWNYDEAGRISDAPIEAVT
jgi:hypothetical protein